MDSRISSRNGYTLIETMFVVGILVIVAMSLSHLVTNSMGSMSAVGLQVERSELKDSLRTLLFSDMACNCSFGSVRLEDDFFSPDNLRDPKTRSFPLDALVRNTDPTNCRSAPLRRFLARGEEINGLKLDWRPDMLAEESDSALRIYDIFPISDSKALGTVQYRLNTGRETPVVDEIPVSLSLTRSGDAWVVASCGYGPASNEDLETFDPNQSVLPFPDSGVLRRGDFHPELVDPAVPPDLDIYKTYMVQIELRGDENYSFEFYDPNDTTRSAGQYAISTGTDGHIDTKTVMAMIPTRNGKFFYTLDARRGGCGRCRITKLASLKALDQAVYFQALAGPFDEGTGPQTLTLNLTRPVPDTDVIVTYQFVNGSAVNGVDYTGVDGTVTFPAGSVAQTISFDVRPNPDVDDPALASPNSRVDRFDVRIVTVEGGADPGVPRSLTVGIRGFN